MKTGHAILFLSLCLTFGCRPTPSTVRVSAEGDSVRYASGFSVEVYTDYTAVEVLDPWNNTRILQRYLLVGRDAPLPSGLPKGTVVRVPLERVVVYTAVHAAIIDELGETDKIIGVCEPQFIDIPAVHDGLRNERIADLGLATAPNVERIIDLDAEVIIASPFQNSGYGAAGKIGIPIIEGADYMELTPLGRAEWGYFFGLLFDREERADSIFRQTEARYMALKELAASADTRPTVLADKRYGATWFVSPGESYMAQFFKDAGADYIFSDLPGVTSVPMAFEAVYDAAIHADFWLIKYNAASKITYSDLRSEYQPYENFDAFQRQQVYACNTSLAGYYEETPMHPDKLLKDLIKVFHPSLLPDYHSRYFLRIEK